MDLKSQIIGLYRKTATDLPEDVVLALKSAMEKETSHTGKEILSSILQNVSLAKKESGPICQDTGTPIFYIGCPREFSQPELTKIIKDATEAATGSVPLRPNAVEILTDKNVGNQPVMHFEESENLGIRLMLKGGGSENISAVCQLPNPEINAGRDLDGVRKCVLDAVFRAQGKGCPPYIIGAAIGGSMEEVVHLSKKELLRNLDDANAVTELNTFEKEVLEEINQLGIGPMGLGGRTTALGVKISTTFRHPASFFVGISIGCWCLRRHKL